MSTTIPFRPTLDRVIVKVVEDGFTSGGLHVPGNAKYSMAVATIVAVGPGKPTNTGAMVPTGFEPGDRVLFPQKLSLELKLGAEKFYMIESHYITIVFTGEIPSGFAAVDLKQAN